jgi:hypothetical protein
MKYFLLLALCLSCSISQKKIQAPPIFWTILEEYNSSWDEEQIQEKLGKPQEIIKQKNNDLWVYNSPITKYQIWAIAIIKTKVSGLAYFPSAPEKKLYIFEVEKRWKDRNCSKKKETKLVADNYQTTQTLECDAGKKVVEYNKYNEVIGISVR